MHFYFFKIWGYFWKLALYFQKKAWNMPIGKEIGNYSKRFAHFFQRELLMSESGSEGPALTQQLGRNRDENSDAAIAHFDPPARVLT